MCEYLTSLPKKKKRQITTRVFHSFCTQKDEFTKFKKGKFLLLFVLFVFFKKKKRNGQIKTTSFESLGGGEFALFTGSLAICFFIG